MTGAATLDERFRAAVALMDAGDVAALERLLAAHPELVRERLEAPGTWLRDRVGGALDGFFRHPFLLWFVAEDPVRNGVLPPNAPDVARAIIDAARRAGVSDLATQLDHAVQLVAWSWIARECGVQVPLLDVLLDAGASPGGAVVNALVNGNEAAARHLVARGVPPGLAGAVCLGLWPEAEALRAQAGAAQVQLALVLAALNGRRESLRWLLARGADVNAPSEELYSHATPLHHAVCSGSLEAVETLVHAGARLDAVDVVWSATPLGWAEYYMKTGATHVPPRDYPGIAAFLRARATAA